MIRRSRPRRRWVGCTVTSVTPATGTAGTARYDDPEGDDAGGGDDRRVVVHREPAVGLEQVDGVLVVLRRHGHAEAAHHRQEEGAHSSSRTVRRSVLMARALHARADGTLARGHAAPALALAWSGLRAVIR